MLDLFRQGIYRVTSIVALRPSSIPGTLEAPEVKFVGLNRTLPNLMHTPIIFEWYMWQGL